MGFSCPSMLAVGTRRRCALGWLHDTLADFLPRTLTAVPVTALLLATLTKGWTDEAQPDRSRLDLHPPTTPAYHDVEQRHHFNDARPLRSFNHCRLSSACRCHSVSSAAVVGGTRRTSAASISLRSSSLT